MSAVLEYSPTSRLGVETSAARLKADFSTPPWVSWPDRRRSERCIEFVERYCRIPTGHGAGEPFRLHPFQKKVLREILEDKASVTAWQVCRGNGKSALIAAMGLWALCDFPDAPQVPLIAKDGKQVERTLFRPLQLMINASPELRYPRTKVYTAAGDKRVHCWWNSGDLMPLPAEADALQGLIPTIAIIDEAELVSFESFWSLRQGAGKRPVSLTVLIGTPGPGLDNALYRHRTHVRQGLPGRYLEMSAPDAEVTDRKAWAKANPAVRAGFLSRDVIADEARVAAVDEDAAAAFRMYRLGQWPDGDQPLTALGRALLKCEDVDATPSGGLLFAVDVGPEDGMDAWILAVGNGVLEFVDHGPGTAWLPARLERLVNEHGGVVVADRYGPIGQRLEDIRRVVPTLELNDTEVRRASARFTEDVLARVPRIKPEVGLRQAVACASRFGTGDAWRWARKLSTGDVAPLVAASIGWWQWVNGAVPGVH